MKSPFNLENQNQKAENKIVVALERISESFRVLLWNESKENTLSPVQIQILIFLLFHSDEKCKVSYLALEFNMTKATISDSVKTLLKKKLVKKITDPDDTRSFMISLTTEGNTVAQKAAVFADPIGKSLGKLSADQKQIMLDGLLKLIRDLHKAGIITIQRMCYTCSNYERVQGKHYCKLLEEILAADQLRIDCAEHEPIQ